MKPVLKQLFSVNDNRVNCNPNCNPRCRSPQFLKCEKYLGKCGCKLAWSAEIFIFVSSMTIVLQVSWLELSRGCLPLWTRRFGFLTYGRMQSYIWPVTLYSLTKASDSSQLNAALNWYCNCKWTIEASGLQPLCFFFQWWQSAAGRSRGHPGQINSVRHWWLLPADAGEDVSGGKGQLEPLCYWDQSRRHSSK